MEAELIFTGTELLLGEVGNTHAQYLGRQLAALNIEVLLHTTVGDDWRRMGEILEQALGRSDLIIITGGLGPTSDDLTKETVARVLGVAMETHEGTLQGLARYFSGRGMTMPASMRKQALFPAGSSVLPNPVGTAPGVLVRTEKNILVMLPGPPREVAAIFEESLVPVFRELGKQGEQIRNLTVKLTGIAESEVQDRLGDLEHDDGMGLAYLALPGEVHVRVTARHSDAGKAEDMLQKKTQQVRSRLGSYVVGYDDEVLEQVVIEHLTHRGLTVAVAESCTGGMVAKRLTDVPGSSQCMLGAVVAYANQIKERLLGVPPPVISLYGAVSSQTATAMARGVRLAFSSDIGVGITGIAGPEGGQPDKPVGTVHIALDTAHRTFYRHYVFPGAREAVRRGASSAALHMMCMYLKNVL
ncbi:MAG: competence/damage-inducible protein A [Peptococcaceae bacterium]|jgi:nicotinamide-nucleotide amidase|nr:competence/damage-inducible protein A [Peptococcaceae bacterium]